MIEIIITLLLIALVAVIAFYIVRMLPFDQNIKNIVMLIVGVIILIALLTQILPLIGVNIGVGRISVQ